VTIYGRKATTVRNDNMAFDTVGRCGNEWKWYGCPSILIYRATCLEREISYSTPSILNQRDDQKSEGKKGQRKKREAPTFHRLPEPIEVAPFTRRAGEEESFDDRCDNDDYDPEIKP